jgi:hypothetical protein
LLSISSDQKNVPRFSANNKLIRKIGTGHWRKVTTIASQAGFPHQLPLRRAERLYQRTSCVGVLECRGNQTLGYLERLHAT